MRLLRLRRPAIAHVRAVRPRFIAIDKAGANEGWKIVGLTHSYPTQSEAIKKAVDAYNRTRLTPFRRRLLRKWLRGCV